VDFSRRNCLRKRRPTFWPRASRAGAVEVGVRGEHPKRASTLVDPQEQVGVGLVAVHVGERLAAQGGHSGGVHRVVPVPRHLLGVDELPDVHLGPDAEVRLEPGDLGVDVLPGPLERQRHPMVPVGDEVRAADLVGLDRRHVAVGEGVAQALQPLARRRATGPEAAVEVAAAVQ
jgi:hypothetical protein